MFQVIDSTDERRAALINKLRLSTSSCIKKCKHVEDCIINDERNQIVEATSATAFIDATIASASISKDHRCSVTPQSTNKKRRICVDLRPAVLNDDQSGGNRNKD
jgi:hypothetical protein